jgi:hypothetical protein
MKGRICNRVDRKLIMSLLSIGVFVFMAGNANAFMSSVNTSTSKSMRIRSMRVHVLSAPKVRVPTFLSSSTMDEEELLSEIKSMRVREIKKELDVGGIDTSDAFEKDELVKRLVKYRQTNQSNSTPDAPSTTTAETEIATEVKAQAKSAPSSGDVITIPMDFHSLTPDKSVPSRNSNVYLRPSPGKYPSINLNVPGQKRPLCLLVDTACSGLVLRPNIIKQYNLPSMNIGVTMTAAGGDVGGGSVSRLAGATLDDGTVLEELMVAGQDIGALPSKLDGIMGLSFLNQFQSVDFDFDGSKILLSKQKNAEGRIQGPMELLSKLDMKMCRIGVWTVDVVLDGRGPVKMLVDTGAASSFLNWKGVESLNMDRNHPLISRNTNALGVMGADNNAFEMSHRFVLKRRVNLTSDPSSVGVFDPQGIDVTEMGSVNIDIGDLPVLETLASDGVGGILGSDILMRCDVLSFNYGTNESPSMSMHKKTDAEKM